VGSTPTRSQDHSSSDADTHNAGDLVTIGAWVQERYHIRHLLGEGGMGQVFLARDNTLARSVALKVVRSSVVGSAHAARILNEARAVAALNHPNIVQLYDVGEHGGTLYLALEYVDGDTLKERASHGMMSKDEVFRHARSIADALVHAHEHGICHCDLKPSNVMVGKDGRLRVVDFGIAQTTEVMNSQVAGTPEWMAPEQWNGASATDRTDIWALAIIVAQLLTGHHPLGDDPVRRRELCLDPELALDVHLPSLDIPPVVGELINRSLQREPSARPGANDWHRALEEVVSGKGDHLAEEGPYRGLSAFDEQHARLFFGRESDVDGFLERLRGVLCLPIVGPSGVGKSSFLHAGVIPRLRARGSWTVISFRPGEKPIAALARKVISVTLDSRHASEVQVKAEALAFEEDLKKTPTLLAVRLATIAAACDSQILIAIDQFEEVFTQCASEPMQRLFIEMLLSAADDVQDPVRIAFTVRDDFVGRIIGLTSLFVLRQMSPQDLRRTIIAPLRRYDYHFDDPGVVEEMLDEVATAQLAVPLVQFACRALWEGRDIEQRLLLKSTYLEMGRIAGALGRHAEAALAEFSPEEHRTARHLLLQLVDRTSRRTVSQKDLLRETPIQTAAVLNRLLAARLLVQRSQGDSEESFVEIAHESLLVNWPQLVRWLDESQDERRFLAELDEAAAIWEKRGRRAEETWSVADLTSARRRAAKLELSIPARALQFLSAGDQYRRAQRRRKWVRAAVIGASVLVLGTVVAGIAIWIGRKAQHNVGIVEFALRPFDYADGNTVPVDPGELPTLRWTLWAIDSRDEHAPSSTPLDWVTVRSRQVRDGRDVYRVEAPGGGAFLKIEGRGRHGENCPPSWIRLIDLPGYATRGEPTPLFELEVPTCRASTWDTIFVEAGPFIYGGPGEPACDYVDDPDVGEDYFEPETEITLPAFSIDRTEVSNAAFAPFATMAKLTGSRVPVYANDALHAADKDPDRPISGIRAFDAQAFCRYLGKELPGDHQWVKAARGGLTVAGRPNLAPRRLYPWGVVAKVECSNVDGAADGFGWIAPVSAFACGASPYGVLNLVGNVDEWISRAGQSDKDNPLWAMRGGSVASPVNLQHNTTVFRNHRDANRFDYGIGLRCAMSRVDGADRHDP
jgi:eukaryotic-like serine/threonine-protein kinase